MITAHVFGTHGTSPHAPAWECLSSVSGFCDRVIVHDYGMSPEPRTLVDEYSRTKRMITVDTLGPRSMSSYADDDWVYLAVLDEIVHEDSHHYLWDVALKHLEFDAVDVPIRTIFGTAGADDLIQTRMVKRSFLADSEFDGDSFFIDLPVGRRAPSGHMPAPVWKFAWAFPGDPSMVEYEVTTGAFTNIQGLPRCVRRLAGRYAYQPPYMK